MAVQKYALISVSDKTGIVAFAENLQELGFKILASGGTAKLLEDHQINVMRISDFTGSPEIFDGRVKTLHPKIHGGILYDRENSKHQLTAKEQEIVPISVVVVNLYPFEKSAVQKKLSLEEAIEFIDIGGPTMLRAAAKNYQHCLALMDPKDYSAAVDDLRQENSRNFSLQMSIKVFDSISQYDREITQYLSKDLNEGQSHRKLRYGENPQQTARVVSTHGGLAAANPLQGKALSYNNYLDLDSAIQIVKENHPHKSVCVVKHTNPCGCAVESQGESPLDLFKRAHSCDPMSAFGGIVAINHEVDEEVANYISGNMFVECIAAKGFTKAALEKFGAKKNLRLLVISHIDQPNEPKRLVRTIDGGYLEQDNNHSLIDLNQWTCPSKAKSNAFQLRELEFAYKISKHVRSNAIVLTKDKKIIGVGAGQMSRIDALQIALQKAAHHKHDLKGSVMASDGFFPFPDCVQLAMDHGISAIVQPGGSKRDQDSILECDKHDVPMYFTGLRGFLH